MTVHTVHTARAVSRRKKTRRGGPLWPPLAVFALLIAGMASFVAYALWPTWPRALIPRNAPALPVTVAGVLFDVPPAAIRVAVQRQSGPHERLDLVFVWPSLAPPGPADETAAKPAAPSVLPDKNTQAMPSTRDRLFVTIARLGAVLAPVERLRSIYPRYVEAQANAGPDGLAVLRFRAGTPYQGEDLIYAAKNPEQFFARCSRDGAAVPGICMQDRALGNAEITFRFPRDWLADWRKVAAGFDRLLTELHPQTPDGDQITEVK